MTIGIAAYGPNAGLGVFKGLEAAEKIGENSIRGFAVYRAITKEDKLMTYKTQRGGTATLVTNGEQTGGLPPSEVQKAKIAAVISSGPDRPGPLEMYLPGDPKVGLVTGHRIVGAYMQDSGKQINDAVLELMSQGITASEAVKSIMDQHPNYDTGLIAVDVNGDISGKSSTKVQNRPDVLEISKEDSDCKVIAFINEIFPKEVAIIAATKCLQVMTEGQNHDLEITLKAGIKVSQAEEDSVLVNDNMDVQSILTTDPTILKGDCIGVAPYINSKIIKGNKTIGYTIGEPLATLKDGYISELSGKEEFKVPVKLL